MLSLLCVCVCEVVVEKMGNACGQRKGIAEDIMLELEVRPIEGLSRAVGSRLHVRRRLQQRTYIDRVAMHIRT